jgi:hypothetical protein
MPSKRIVIEQFHLTVTVPGERPGWESAAALRALNRRAFQAALTMAVRAVVAADSRLARVRVVLSR